MANGQICTVLLVPSLGMIVVDKGEGYCIRISFYLLRTFAARDDASDCWMLQAPSQSPRRHVDAFRNLILSD